MDTNAKIALNNLKMEIANELGYKYNEMTDKVVSNAPQNTLMGHAKNILAGEDVGGLTSRRLVEMGEKALLEKYNTLE